MLLHDLQNVKMSFCPIAFVLGDEHISEVQYEKIKAFDWKKNNKAQLDCTLCSTTDVCKLNDVYSRGHGSFC